MYFSLYPLTVIPDNQYTYDDLDRLTEADYLIGLLTEDEQFTYDKLGNRENVNLRDGTNQDYAVNYLTNRYDNDQSEDIVCTYDDAGNTTVDPNGYQYTYDYENRIIEIKDKDSISIVEYAYNALGRRVQVYDMAADAKTRYYYNEQWQVLKETDEEGYGLRWYIYGNYIDEVLVMVDPNVAADYYYAHNHLYSPVALLDDASAILERYEYDAYGKMTRLDPDFTAWSGAEAGNPYYFTGRNVDFLDNGNLILQYNRHRYYDYKIGRWLNQDPLGVVPVPNGFINQFNILTQYRDGLNLYQYIGSRPLIYTDPYGYWCLWGICFGEADVDYPWLAFNDEFFPDEPIFGPDISLSNPKSTYLGIELTYLFICFGFTSVNCTDEVGITHDFIYFKAGPTAGAGLTGGGGVVGNMDGENCRPDKYREWFWEGGLSAGPIGVDIGETWDWPWGTAEDAVQFLGYDACAPVKLPKLPKMRFGFKVGWVYYWYLFDAATNDISNAEIQEEINIREGICIPYFGGPT